MHNLREFEGEARRRLPPTVSDYYDGGAEDEQTLARNEQAWQQWRLRQRVLVDVSDCPPGTTVMGIPLQSPVLVAPTAYQCMAHPEGERATARAAARAGTLMVASSLSTCSLEDIAAATSAPLWFQLYVYRRRSVSENLVRRAEAAGYRAIVVTVDVPVQGRRERDVRSRFALPAPWRMANFSDDVLSDLPPDPGGGSGLAHYINAWFDPTLDWRMLDWLRSITGLPIILKGIMTGQDAATAVSCGVQGIVVSNHGGRQLDAGQGTADVLEEVVAAVAGGCEVYVDGGIRRGADVLKAMALGARAVFVGRPVLWGLAVDGEAGVYQVLSTLTTELQRTMQLCGCAGLTAVTRRILTP